MPGAGLARGDASAPAAARPRLVLFVSVDQMWFDYLDRFAAHYTGGLERLREEGAVFTNAYYRHANSETGPGHALLLSGRHARDNGIVANAWYDRTSGAVVNVVGDPLVAPLPGPGRGASPANFTGATVGDLLKRASPASRVVGVAGKDRSAILMAGPRADAAYWYEAAAGVFGSSTYYMKRCPPWLAEWNATRPVDALAGRSWTRLLDAPVVRGARGPGRRAGRVGQRRHASSRTACAAPPARPSSGTTSAARPSWTSSRSRSRCARSRGTTSARTTRRTCWRSASPRPTASAIPTAPTARR